MTWTDQDPPAENVIFSCHITAGNWEKGTTRQVWVEIDRLEAPLGGALWRATAGNLFGSEEIARHKELDTLLMLVMMKAAQAK